LTDNFFTYLPQRCAAEIKRLLISRGVSADALSEIRLRGFGRSSVVISGERVPLFAEVGCADISKALTLMCDGALYARRDTIKDGYITLDFGVRVGVCGEARYDGGVFVGVSDVTSLVFRIPSARIARNDEILTAFKNCKRGMLIYSPPGVGKTTALRTLAYEIGKSSSDEQVAVIDERGEFYLEDYKGASVDVLRGYKRETGIAIALRTLSPSVIAVDEIGRLAEAEAMLESLNSGVRIVATAHAKNLSELRKRKSIAPFFEREVFDVLVGISVENGKRKISVSEENI
jgi:stage III sporulation protein AA